ncbi:MAG: hypothetical protein JEZ08_12625 [Clostridiales bacterium]|nr:hypothetical protein [Clostridiales bacterium]
MIITLCGSARFRNEIDETQKSLALQGHQIFTIENLNSVEITKEIESMLDVSHRKKIDVSDAIYVINVDGYIGESTSNEIKYARDKGKKVMYLE